MSSFQNALDRSKIILLQSRLPFIASLICGMEHKIGNKFPVAYTNGTVVYYNPDVWVDEMDEQERTFVMAHEAGHVMFDHFGRRAGRDPHLWGAAGDYVINDILIRAGLKMPQGKWRGLYDVKFHGMSTDQVYDYLKKHNIEPPPLPQHIFMEPSDPNDEEGITSPQQQNMDIKNLIIRAHVQTQMFNKGQGTGIAELDRFLDSLLNPKLHWTELLHRFINSYEKSDYAWKKINRRFFPDFYMPSLYDDSMDNLTVAIDTSGSVSQDELKEMLTEIKYIYDVVQPKNFRIMDCDEKIHNIYTDEDIDRIEDLKFTGGGGTNFSPVFDNLRNNPPNLLIYFTDLYANQIEEDPGYPVLWICYSNHAEAPIGETIYYERS